MSSTDACVMGPGGCRRRMVTDAGGTAKTITAPVGQGGGNRQHDVRTVQELLNTASDQSGVPHKRIAVDGLVGPETIRAIREFQQAHFLWADGRVDPNQKTLAKLNEIAFGSADSGTVTAEAAVKVPKPMDFASDVQGEALRWVQAAQAQLLLSRTMYTTPPSIPSVKPFINVAVDTHFHLDQAAAPLPLLDYLSKIFGLIMQTITNSKFYYQNDTTGNIEDFAYTWEGGYHLPGTTLNKICFCKRFTHCGPLSRTAMIIHECAHFVGGQDKAADRIGHYASELPFPEGANQDGPKNYRDLDPADAVHNACSYAAFTCNVAFARDLRYGAQYGAVP